MSIQAPRKLLILDLNGTLLLRSKHTRHGPSVAHLPMRSRIVHPRPYLNSFREYIFHPSTAAWLDTMVWSSAQPPSVADMVNRCFGDQQRKFLAIWARDTLGLAPELYNRKTQTTKDLETPWAAFPTHNARTTLLLDDSALKAHLHPHNHVCVREYLAETRAHDLMVWRSTLLAGAMPEKPKKKAKSQPKNPSGVSFLSPTKYDETLLAVVGILDTLKTQTDVAGWIRGGGLLANPAAEVNTEEAQPPSPDSLVPQMAALNLAQELWFNSEAAVSHWVGQGVHALEALQIAVDAGIRN
ncbi:hypothetical protein DFH09DRAFT_56582 [Mycena vulgaris]|nr:hypothetical protein DFH09DRAFT_56582 [Mycena vulgaris]